jgi:cytochrome P450
MHMSTPTASRPTIDSPDADISARDFWAKPYMDRDREVFERFRQDCPVSWHRPYESTLLPPDEDTPGFWSLWKHEDIRHVSRNAKTFISSQGFLMEDFPEAVATMSQSFLFMDDPEHQQMRALVSLAFTPRRMRQIEGWVHEEVVKLCEEVGQKGEIDFANEFAKELPGRIFADFFGVHDGEIRATIMDAAEKMLAWDDPEAQQGRDALETYGEEAQRLLDVCFDLIEERRKTPGEDLVSWLIAAEVDGRTLEDWEIGAFFSLLGSAANDTTRHSLAHALNLFTDHQDQRALLMSDFPKYIDGAVEEVLRYSTPVMHFRRTATEDTEIRGVKIAEGEKVVMWYCSGNHDSDAFDDHTKFDITRETRNAHLGFGGGGPHYCMGAALGRQMVKYGLTEVFGRFPDIEAHKPHFQTNNFINGVHQMRTTWTPPSA